MTEKRAFCNRAVPTRVRHVVPRCKGGKEIVPTCHERFPQAQAVLKPAFAKVLQSKQEGQAALERARGESAALRNLANAATLLEGNPAWMNLRQMQSLSAAQNASSTLVLGMPGGFVPLKNGKPTGTSEPSAEG